MPIGLGTAMLGSSAISAGLGAMGQSDAADARSDAIQESIRLTRQQMQRAEEQFTPYAEAGQEALGQFQENVGDVPSYEQTLQTLQQDPGFQFQMDQGLDAIEGSAAARGTLQSGNTLESLTEFGQNLASTRANEAFQRDMNSFNTRNNMLQNLMQTGFQGAGNIVTGQGAAPQLQQLALQQGQVGAQEAIGQTNNLQNLLNNATFAGMAGGQIKGGRQMMGLPQL